MAISKLCNQYYQDKQPWFLIPKKRNENEEISEEKKIEEEKNLENASFITYIGIQLVYHLNQLLEPYMPGVFEKISTYLNIKEKKFPSKLNIFAVTSGHSLSTPIPLFQKILDSRIKELRTKFGEKEPFRGDIRVGTIEEVEEIEKNNKLWYLTINFGEEKLGTRKVVAGIRQNYPKKELLLNKKIVAITNLGEVDLQGKISQAMVLVGKTKKELTLLTVNDEKISDGTQLIPNGLKINSEKPFSQKELKDFLKQFKYDSEQQKIFFKSFQLENVVLSNTLKDKKISIC